VLRSRLRIRRVIVVADRAMIGQDIASLLAEDREAPFDYILGCRMRRQKEVRDEVLARAGRYHEVAGNLQAKEVRVEGRRYVVCRNPDEARKDAAARPDAGPRTGSGRLPHGGRSHLAGPHGPGQACLCGVCGGGAPAAAHSRPLGGGPGVVPYGDCLSISSCHCITS
jgi:hypothetical protein